MKKSFVLLITLVLLAVTVVCFGMTSLMAERDQVKITEHVHYGDKSVVEGVTLQMKNHYQNQMFWDTTYVLGKEPNISTEYTFYQTEQYNHDYWYYGSVNFEDGAIHAVALDWSEDKAKESLEGMELAVQELYDSIGPSERGEKLFYVKDYVEYYPFSVYITGDYDTKKNMEKLHLELDEAMIENELYYAEKQSGKNYSYSEEFVEELKQQKKWLETFQAFFKVPVLDNDACVIAMEKDANGELLGYGTASIRGGGGTGDMDMPEMPNYEDYDSYWFDVKSAVSNGNAYFTFNTHSFNNVVVDTSQIPGGYGIYHFPYDESKNEIYPEKLQMVYPLDTNIIVHDLTMDKRGEHLLLFAEEEDGIYMSVINIATMTLENKIGVSVVREDGSFYGIDYYTLLDEYMVIATWDEIVLITIDEAGNYQKEFVVSRSELEKFNIDQTGNTQIVEWDTVFDWDGERLLLANHFYNSNGYTGCNFYVGVVDAGGVQFFATYESSLQSTVSNDSDGYTVINYQHCRPVDDEPMKISW